jgi:D-glycero-D-manno-heptose 1,7-bisphosphate phosphatase
VSRPAVFLDRDGVVNEVVEGPGGEAAGPVRPEDLVVPPDAAPAVARLRAAGYALVLVTNQPDIARGNATAFDVDAINTRLVQELGLDAAYVCPHDNDAACDCRKPRPGMLLAAARDLGIDLGASWLVGDRWVDIGAAAAAGVRSILLDRAYSWKATSSGGPPDGLAPTIRVATLAEAADRILTGADLGTREGNR